MAFVTYDCNAKEHPMLEFLLTALIVAVVIYVAIMILDMLGLPPPVRMICVLIIAVIALVWLLDSFGGGTAFHTLR